MISKVAASEMERGQTEMRASRGSDRIIDSTNLAERFWESLPKRVKAPYAKDLIDMAVSRVHRDTRNLDGMSGDHPVSLNTP